VEEVAQGIVAEYDITAEVARADLVALGDELVAQGLLVHDEAAGQRA
jgi:hypothetical protein